MVDDEIVPDDVTVEDLFDNTFAQPVEYDLFREVAISRRWNVGELINLDNYEDESLLPISYVNCK
jgi:hypothetical protein